MTWYEDRNAKIYAAKLAGATIAEIARRWLISGRQVDKVLTRERKKARDKAQKL